MTQLKLSIFCSMAAGTVGSIATHTVFLSHREASPSEGPVSSTRHTEPTHASSKEANVYVTQPDSEQLRALRAEVAQLRVEREAEPSVPTAPSTPEEGLERAEATLAELERRHRNDPEDPKWATVASAALETGLAHLSERYGFLVRSANCRTTYCRASLDWKDFESARAAGGVLAETMFPGLNCVQTVRLKAPENPRAVYSTDLYLDCTSLRAGTVEVAYAPE
jgi:hypothetical protein